MRIAHLIDGLYIGGADRLLVTFAETASAHSIEPTVIPLRIYSGTPYVDQLRAAKTRVVEFRGRNLVDPVRFARLVAFLRRERFDVLHTHLTYAIILGSLAGRLTGTPVVATLHNTQPDRWLRLESFALRYGAGHVIADGIEIARAYQTRLPNKTIEVVLNVASGATSITPEERLMLRSQMAGDPNRTVLIAVGRLAPQKGYDDLLVAVHHLQEKHPSIVLAIAGIGELGDRLTTRIAELGLQNSVKLLGARNDVPRLLEASDIFVSSSHWEGLPVAVLEAMSAGLPIVATNVGDVPQVITPETGLIVPPHQPLRLAEALNTLCSDSKLRARLGASARNYVTQHHNPNAWLDQIAAVYAKATSPV